MGEAALGMKRTGASGLFAMLAISGLVVQLGVLPCLIQRMNIARILVLGLSLQVLENTVLVLMHQESAVALACVVGGFGSIVFPCVSALKANAASPEEQGRIQGAVSSLQS